MKNKNRVKSDKDLTKPSFKEKLKKSDIVKNKGRYLLLLPALFLCILFCYIPMVGVLIAFEDYDPVLGFFKSNWVGLANFKFFFSSSSWLSVTINTLYLNVLFIITGTVVSLVIAIIMSEIQNKYFKKISQTFMTLPNFVSWATIALFSVSFFSSNGIINNALDSVGADPISFYTTPEAWPLSFVLIRIWKGGGWGAIIYMSALLSINTETLEAAEMDGASRMQIIFKIKLPSILPTVVLMTILSIGNIFKGDFGMIYPFIGDNSLLYPTTDVIDTYVFRALRTFTNYGRTAAIGLYQSFMGFILVILSNRLAKRFAPDSAIF